MRFESRINRNIMEFKVDKYKLYLAPNNLELIET